MASSKDRNQTHTASAPGVDGNEWMDTALARSRRSPSSKNDVCRHSVMRALTRLNSLEYNPFTISCAVCLTGEFKGGKSDDDSPRELGKEGTLNSGGTSMRDPRKELDSREAEPKADDCDGL
eukprot:1264333-Pleurochrysis_carterae.AAC.1